MQFTLTANTSGFAAARKQMRAAEEAALGDVGEHLLEESNRGVPHEEGTLERSGEVSQDGLTVQVSYDTPYAARQHEEMTWRHASGRRAKWLQLTFQESAGRVAGWLAATLRRRVR